VEGCAKLPHGYVAEKTNPGALELKKSPSSLDQEGLCSKIAIIDKEIFVYQINDHMWYKNRFRDINRI